jgi:hypothetical protein
MVERALASGNIEEIIGKMPDRSPVEVRQWFLRVMDKRTYNEDNIEDVRAYVSAFIEFVACVCNSCKSSS